MTTVAAHSVKTIEVEKGLVPVLKVLSELGEEVLRIRISQASSTGPVFAISIRPASVVYLSRWLSGCEVIDWLYASSVNNPC
jgi:hypothetical protein